MSQEPAKGGELFFSVFEASPIGIALEDLEGRPLYANPALWSMLGFTEDELRNKYCVEFSPPDDAEKDWALFEQLRAGSSGHKTNYARDLTFRSLSLPPLTPWLDLVSLSLNNTWIRDAHEHTRHRCRQTYQDQ